MTLNILILDEGSPGHCAQSEGIVALLERQGLEIRRDKIRVRNRLPGVLRGLMRKLMAIPSYWLNERCLRLCCQLEADPVQRPDLIISSGGKSAFASLILKRRYGAANIFVGVPEPFPDRWFDLIISPVARAFRTRSLVSGLIPNSVTPERVASAGAEYWQQGLPPQPCWALLIGGDSKSHRYSERDWEGLVSGVNALSARFGVCWLITTSRRTPEAVEAMLEAGLNRQAVVDLVLYNREPRRVMQPFLAGAQRVLVSQDSLTMASEALCSARPVTLLTPEVLKLDPGSFFEEMIEGFPHLPGVERCAMAQLNNYSPEQVDSDPGAILSLDRMAPELLSSIQQLTEACSQR
ncbi:MAG: hypothetical protein GYB21_16405 [Oceanospirillales bacterium]|nr:hypothetical protein [Oceanospirillales bacterium]